VAAPADGGGYPAPAALEPALPAAAAHENRGRAAEMAAQMQELRTAAPAAIRTLLPFANDRPMLQGVSRRALPALGYLPRSAGLAGMAT
jgi:hypothetical protein